MNKIKIYLISLFVFFSLLTCNNPDEIYIRKPGIESIDFKVLTFDIKDVELLEGPFLHATQLNRKILLDYEPDRLLAKFRIEAGLKPKAEHYSGWENETLAGHSLGHYLSACALMFNTTGDSIFLDRVNYIVKELNLCQQTLGSGYLGAAPGARKVFEEEIVKGDIRSKGFDLNGIWAPIYTQHKIMAGLLDAYNLCQNKTALRIAKNFADWMESYITQISHEQIQEMLHCEHGGINEALANLYGLTGEKKYLDLANKFYHEEILIPLSEGIDILPGKHANTQIPKIIGLSRIYELTGDSLSQKTTTFFWDRVVNHHSYVTGGHCDHEYFGPPDTLRNRLSESTTETCNVYNMLKLSSHLFEWNALAEVADFYERALFNHILASQHPESGKVIYNLSLDMGGYKTYQEPGYFTCCVGTGMENHAKYPKNIYYYNDKELYISQFIASRLNWKEKGIVIEQNTKYPEEQGTILNFSCEKPVDLVLTIRYPYWAERGINVKVNGKKYRVKQKAGSFIEICKNWKDGDKVEVEIPFSLRIETMPDDENRIAFLYGPIVLAGDLGSVEDTNANDPMYVPVFIADKEKLYEWVVPVKGEINTFITKNTGRPRNVTLKPFYKIHDRRYSIYWDIFTEQKWQQFQEEYKAEMERKKEIEKITIDFFQLGEMQPERDHKFEDGTSYVGQHKGRNYREARDWMSCELSVNYNRQNSLMVDYWGGFPGHKTFDILVDDIKLATENISNKNDGKFVTIEYKIPKDLILNKNKITVKFLAHDGHRAGPVFGVRTIKL